MLVGYDTTGAVKSMIQNEYVLVMFKLEVISNISDVKAQSIL